MGHDQLFKAILEGLFQDFLELCLPEAAARFDFRTLSFVEKEIFANVPDGEVRQADVVARIEATGGERELVRIAIEHLPFPILPHLTDTFTLARGE